MTSSRSLVFLSLILFAPLLGGCVDTERVPFEYRLPLESNSQGAATAANCARTCETANPHDTGGFFACLGLCPDVTVSEGACSPESYDNPPVALCYEHTVVRETDTSSEVGEAIARTAFEVLGKVLVAAVGGSGSGSSESGRHETHHHERETQRSASRSYVQAHPKRTN